MDSAQSAVSGWEELNNVRDEFSHDTAVTAT